MTKYILPVLFLAGVIYAFIKKVKPYDVFVEGVSGVIPLLCSLFPYIVTVMLLTELFYVSGASDCIVRICSPFFEFLGIPAEIAPLVIVKPFSGSGSTALLSELLFKYGADSYVARCACVCYGSSETVFYIAAVYFSTVKQKKLGAAITIALASIFISTIFACFLCKVL